MGLSSAALFLIFILSLSSPATSLSILSSHYSIPTLKSLCVDYVCSLWSRARAPFLITPRNLFVLVNIIILLLLISLHFQQRAPAAGTRRSRNGRQLRRTENRTVNDMQSAQLQNLQVTSPLRDLTGDEAVAMAEEALISSERVAAKLPENLQSDESGSAYAASVQERSTAEGEESLMSTRLTTAEGSGEEVPAVGSDCINGSGIERIVLEEDGRLRLVVGEGDTDGAVCAVKIVPDEDEQLRLIEDAQQRLIEALDGLDDAEKIVLEEDGRLRLIDRPWACSVSSSGPRKSHSTGDDTYDRVDKYDQNVNPRFSYDSNISLEKLDDDSTSLNHNVETDINELNNDGGVPIIDCSLPQNPSNAEATLTNKSSSRRPMRAKKADSLDATWKSISKNNKGSNFGNRENKHLIRQSSRQDFKPSRGSNGMLTRPASHSNGTRPPSHNNNARVRREPSIGQDELNAKVESFIANFNEQIRIQRQQSILSYMQMVDRGA